MAAAPRCSFCPAVAVRQGRPAGSGGRYVTMCGSDRCAAELVNRSNLALVGYPIGEQLSRWLDGMAAKLDPELAPAIIAATKRTANNSPVNTSTLQGYTFMVYPLMYNYIVDGKPHVSVTGMVLGRGTPYMRMLIGKTLNTPELLAEYMRTTTASLPSVEFSLFRDKVVIKQYGETRFTITLLTPVGSVTEPSFWLVEGLRPYFEIEGKTPGMEEFGD